MSSVLTNDVHHPTQNSHVHWPACAFPQVRKYFERKIIYTYRSSPDFTEETPVADREDKVTFYVTIFGWMQLFCLLVAPVIGKVLDQDLDSCRDDPIAGVRSRDSNSTNAFRRVQALRNTRNAYLITEVSYDFKLNLF